MSNCTSAAQSTEADVEILPSSLNSRKKRKTNPSNSNVIDLTADDDDDPRVSLGRDGAMNADTSVDDDDDEVLVVEAPATKVTPVEGEAAARHTSNSKDDDDDNDEDIQVMGTVNAMRLPHMRCHCTEYPFSEKQHEKNIETCDLCYCYVCDVPVKECTDWEMLHCDATDKGPKAFYWSKLRQEKHCNSKPSATVLKARLAHGKLFKNIFQTLGKFLEGVCLECIPGVGIKCTARQETEECVFFWELGMDAFETFQCREETLLNVQVSHVNEIMRSVKKKSHAIVLNASSSFLSISVEDSTKGESETTRVSLCRNSFEAHYGMPERRHECNARIRSADFKRIIGHIRYLRCTSFDVSPLSRGPNSISFKGCGPEGRCRFTLQRGRGRVPGAFVEMTKDSGLFEVGVATRILYLLTRTPPMSPNVSLRLAPSVPLQVEYDLRGPSRNAKLGRFSCFVAPVVLTDSMPDSTDP